MLQKNFAVVAAAIVMAISALPAEAARKQKQSQTQARYQSASPSLDGRVTGRERTCGFDTFMYDGKGATIGPYCH